MTVTDHKLADDAAFLARFADMDARPDAPESYAATVERMARAMWAADSGDQPWSSCVFRAEDFYYRRMAEAALRVVTEPADPT